MHLEPATAVMVSELYDRNLINRAEARELLGIQEPPVSGPTIGELRVKLTAGAELGAAIRSIVADEFRRRWRRDF